MAKIVVIIPAVDEEPSIARVLADVPAVVDRVVVVDNGSRDRTAEVAREAGAEVVHEPRRGYGQACLRGIAAAGEAEILAFLDADYSDYPEQLTDVLAPILAGEAELVIGSRNLGRRAAGAHPWHAVAGTKLCVFLMNRLIGTRATDLGPFRAITRPALERLDMQDRDYGWTAEMQVKAGLMGLRVAEVGVDYRPRIGRSKVSGTLGGSLRAGFKIIATIVRGALVGRRHRAGTP
jgi:glycosyltransferase involved in cell wall biosynthesis